MAAPKRPNPQGPKSDKLIRDAIMLELHDTVSIPVDMDNPQGPKIKMKKLRLVARALVNEAIRGNVVAAKEIADRVDGRVPLPVVGGEEPIRHEVVAAVVEKAMPDYRNKPLAELIREHAALTAASTASTTKH